MPSEIMTKQEPQVKSWYLTQETPLPQYYQFPEFLLKAPVSQTAKILYMVLYDRARLSQRNNWTDDAGRIYLVFPIIELAAKTGRSVSAVKAGLNELLAADLLEKLYFVLETKGSTSFMDLRTREQLKIHCGRKHFEALNNGIEMQVATNWSEIKARV